MKRERYCKWFFDKQTGREYGPRDALVQNFVSKPYASLVSESIQNSLDARINPEIPVVVQYSFKTIKSVDFPNFFTLRKHIKGCIDYYPRDMKAKEIYSGMLKNFPDTDSSREISYIRISDYNTKGMWYEGRNTSSPFYAFLLAAGVSSKESQSSGGSFGFGKAAYFQMSPFGTIIVSTLTDNNQYVFQGAASLCTHIVDDTVLTSVGYYGIENGKPILKEEEIPVPFKRKEQGTDINIMGFDISSNPDEAKKEIIEEVLRNFWFAILDDKLIVIVDREEINSNNIDEYMNEYFPLLEDNTRKTGYSNPRPYYESVKGVGTDNKHIVIEEKLPTIGNVVLFIHKVKGATDKIAYFREQKMLIYSKRTQTLHGVYGVFYCPSKPGNKILKELEGSSHAEWKASNWRDSNNRIIDVGQNALNEINDFVINSLDALFYDGEKTTLNITDLEDYLYMPSEEMPSEEIIDSSAENPFSGYPTGELMDVGTSINTNIENDPIKKPDDKSNKGDVVVITSGTSVVVNPNENSNTKVGIHKRNTKKKKKKGEGNSPGDYDVPGEISNTGINQTKIYVPVLFKVAAQKDGDGYIHHIHIKSDIDILNGEIELISSGEQNDDKVIIVKSSIGKPDDNIIRNVVLSEGDNVVSVKFDDSMMHSLKLKTYENK